MFKLEKEHKHSTLMSRSKKELVEQIMRLEYNNNILFDTINQQAENFKILTQHRWIPVTERLPETDESGYAYVMVCMDDEFVAATDYTRGEGFGLWVESGDVVAWMPLPEPYSPES